MNTPCPRCARNSRLQISDLKNPFSSLQHRWKKNFFNLGELLRQAFSARVGKQHYEHSAILPHTERVRIDAECRCLSRSIIAFEVKVSGIAEIRPFVRRVLALAKNFVQLAG